MGKNPAGSERFSRSVQVNGEGKLLTPLLLEKVTYPPSFRATQKLLAPLIFQAPLT